MNEIEYCFCRVEKYNDAKVFGFEVMGGKFRFHFVHNSYDFGEQDLRSVHGFRSGLKG